MKQGVGKWKNLVDEYAKKRKAYLKREHGFRTKNFGGEYETSIGLDFSIRYMMDCFPEPMLSWPIEKQAEFATAEVRANTLHKEDWTFSGIRSFWALGMTIIIQLISAAIDADGVGNLAFHSLYSTNPSHRRNAWILYQFDKNFVYLLKMSRMVKGLLISIVLWFMVIGFGIPTPWYWIFSTIIFMVFMFFLWHINILLGKRKRAIYPTKWESPKVEDFTEDQKKKRLDVWDARILLARSKEEGKDK